MIRVLIVDDRPDVRLGLRMLLEVEPDMTVVGEAANSAAALHLAVLLHPDVVLMDVAMPSIDGISALQAMKRTCTDVPVIILSIHCDRLTRERAVDAGAAAFIDKSTSPDCVLQAIRRVVD